MADIEKVLELGNSRGTNFQKANEKFAEIDGDIGELQQQLSTLDQEIDRVSGEAGKIDQITVGGKATPIKDKVAAIGVSTDFAVTKNASTGALTLSIPTLEQRATQVELNLDATSYTLTASLKDKNGNVISTSNAVDLPLEELIVSGSYNEASKDIVLTLKNGKTITIVLDDLTDDLVSTPSAALTSGNIIIGNGGKTVSASSAKITNAISTTTNTNVPTAGAVKTYVDTNAFGETVFEGFSTTASNGVYVANFTSTEKILCPLFIISSNGDIVFVDWTSITNGWQITSDVSLSGADAHFISLSK